KYSSNFCTSCVLQNSIGFGKAVESWLRTSDAIPETPCRESFVGANIATAPEFSDFRPVATVFDLKELILYVPFPVLKSFVDKKRLRIYFVGISLLGLTSKLK